VLPDYLKVNLASKKHKEIIPSTEKANLSTMIKHSSTKKLILTEVFSGSNKISQNEKLITTSFQAKSKADCGATAGLTCSYGNITSMPSKLTRPTKFCKSFKTSSKADLVTMETNTPKATISNFIQLETSDNLMSPRKNNKLSPKSVKSKLNLSKGFVADRSTQLGRNGRPNKLVTDRIFIDDLSESQNHQMEGQDNTGYPNSSYTDFSRGTAARDSSVESPLKEPNKIKLVNRSKSKFYRQKISMVELHKTQGNEQTDKGTPKQKNKHFVPGPRLDADGLLVEDKHRDYKLNNMFKMIEFLEKDQNLTSNRLELRVIFDYDRKKYVNSTRMLPI
jgi:hypothetical protein